MTVTSRKAVLNDILRQGVAYAVPLDQRLSAHLNTLLYMDVATPTALTATGTLTEAQLENFIITCNSATAVTLTLPTGALMDAGLLMGAEPVDTAIPWCLINIGSASGAVTIAAGTGHTIVGNPVVAINTSMQFVTRKTAANTFVTYVIG